MGRRNWQAKTIEKEVSDAFVFFRGLSLDGWEAWLDARDRGEEEPRWEDLDPWESMSIYEISVMHKLAGWAEDLRPLRIAWRVSRPKRGQRWDRRVARIQEHAIAIAGADPSDPMRDPGFLAAK